MNIFLILNISRRINLKLFKENKSLGILLIVSIIYVGITFLFINPLRMKNNDLEKQNFNLFRENATLKAERKDNTNLKNEFYYQSEELQTEKEKNKELEKKYKDLENENIEYFNLLKKYNIFEIEKKKKLEMQKKSSDVPNIKMPKIKKGIDFEM